MRARALFRCHQKVPVPRADPMKDIVPTHDGAHI